MTWHECTGGWDCSGMTSMFWRKQCQLSALIQSTCPCCYLWHLLSAVPLKWLFSLARDNFQTYLFRCDELEYHEEVELLHTVVKAFQPSSLIFSLHVPSSQSQQMQFLVWPLQWNFKSQAIWCDNSVTSLKKRRDENSPATCLNSGQCTQPSVTQ